MIHRHKYHEPYYQWRKKDDGRENTRALLLQWCGTRKAEDLMSPKNQRDATLRAALIITTFSVQRGPAQNAV